MMRTILILAICSAASAAFAASGQVYKWTDAQGVVHYSDAPPPTKESNVQQVRVSGGDRPHAADGDAAAVTAPEANTQVAQNNVPPPAAPPANDQCASARSNLELLQSKFQVSVAGPDGKPQPMDPKTRQVQIATLNEQVKQFCK